MESAGSYANLYPLVRSGALFVMVIGAAIVAGFFWPRSRMALLALGAALAAIVTALSAATLTALYGAPTIAQVAWPVVAVAVEVVALMIVIRHFAERGERALLVAILVVVGLHFLPMAPAFGPLAAVLGVACTANALFAVHLSNYPLQAVWAVDGGLKVVLGALMWSLPLIGNHANAAV